MLFGFLGRFYGGGNETEVEEVVKCSG